MSSSCELGRNGEDAILFYLMRRGYTLIYRNFAVHNVGEIDLVMLKDYCLYFVEVKSRLIGSIIETPIEAITYSKRKKLYKTASIFMSRFGYDDYDICYFAGCVSHNKSGIIQKIEIIPFE